jgi:hypothetical protein
MGHAERVSIEDKPVRVLRRATVELVHVPGQEQPSFRLQEADIQLLRAWVTQVISDDASYAQLFGGPHVVITDEMERQLRGITQPGNGKGDE